MCVLCVLCSVFQYVRLLFVLFSRRKRNECKWSGSWSKWCWISTNVRIEKRFNHHELRNWNELRLDAIPFGRLGLPILLLFTITTIRSVRIYVFDLMNESTLYDHKCIGKFTLAILHLSNVSTAFKCQHSHNALVTLVTRSNRWNDKNTHKCMIWTGKNCYQIWTHELKVGPWSSIQFYEFLYRLRRHFNSNLNSN